VPNLYQTKTNLHIETKGSVADIYNVYHISRSVFPAVFSLKNIKPNFEALGELYAAIKMKKVENWCPLDTLDTVEIWTECKFYLYNIQVEDLS